MKSKNPILDQFEERRKKRGVSVRTDQKWSTKFHLNCALQNEKRFERMKNEEYEYKIRYKNVKADDSLPIDKSKSEKRVEEWKDVFQISYFYSSKLKLQIIL